MGKRTWNRTGTLFALLAAALATVLALSGCSGTPHPRNITLTLVRHAESEANAAGILDTSVPGPGLTEKGRVQAQEIADQLSRGHHDGVYASSMVRTQQTAAPLARELGRQVQILPGLREISAGWFGDKPRDVANSAYWLAPQAWLHGDRTAAIPGSIDGNQFNDEFSAAIQQIYDSGDTNPVAFAHGASIATWTLMNVKNPRDELLIDHPLPNLGKVVITGNPATGWKLLDWDGIRAF
ncbi:histidine phosphatase family protein [Mycolicibacter heraklionensis]|uniref:histidine phosphatase family protein n=1 Tax=Mycolicibacter heraklionensis TaxID=512402 RepID=UPI0007EAD388|nr:histidine phosphatase family protein [Mycolicibacter heraklionensis]OBG36994.1 histidine phosphatase family protein [Mycolicibacter heraklionensis]